MLPPASSGLAFLIGVKDSPRVRTSAPDKSEMASVSSMESHNSSISKIGGQNRKRKLVPQSQEELDEIVAGIKDGSQPRKPPITRDKLKQPKTYIKEFENVPRTRMAAEAKKMIAALWSSG